MILENDGITSTSSTSEKSKDQTPFSCSWLHDPEDHLICWKLGVTYPIKVNYDY